MKVVYIHNILWSHYKGAVLNEVYNLLNSSGEFDLHTIHLCENQRKRKNLGEIDYSFHKYSYEVLERNKYLEELRILSTTRALKSRLKILKPDCVIFSGINHISFWPLIFDYGSRDTKVIVEFNSIAEGKDRRGLKEIWKKTLLQRTDAVICYGVMHQAYLKALEVPSKKIFRKIQATENSQFKSEIENHKLIRSNSNVDVLKILYVGRLSAEKNLFTLLEVFRQVVLVRKVKLVIVGDGPLKKELFEFINQNEISSVEFKGSMGWKEVAKYYLESDIFILPSVSETWGLVVNEAMLCKLPILISKHCGCSADLVEEGRNGYTFDPLSIEDLRNKLLLLLDSPDKLKDMGEYSYEIIKDYTPQKAAQQLITCVNAVIK